MVDAIIYYSLNTHPTACVLLTAPPHLVSLILSLSLSLSVISSAFTDFDFECCRTRLKIKVKKKKTKKKWTGLDRTVEKLDAELPNFLNLDFEFGCSEPDILLEVDAELPNFLNLDFSFGFSELLHKKKKERRRDRYRPRC